MKVEANHDEGFLAELKKYSALMHNLEPTDLMKPESFTREPIEDTREKTLSNVDFKQMRKIDKVELKSYRTALNNLKIQSRGLEQKDIKCKFRQFDKVNVRIPGTSITRECRIIYAYKGYYILYQNTIKHAPTHFVLKEEYLG